MRGENQEIAPDGDRQSAGWLLRSVERLFGVLPPVPQRMPEKHRATALHIEADPPLRQDVGTAAANGVERAYAGRILRLASLASDVVERILDGSEPEGISLAKLRANLPFLWTKQGGSWLS